MFGRGKRSEYSTASPTPTVEGGDQSLPVGKSRPYFSTRPRLPGGVVFGLIIIGLGIALALENLKLIYIEDAAVFLPCILILAGLVRLWNRGFFSVWGQILLLGGIILQIEALDFAVIVDLSWPMLIIWVGLLVAIKAFLPKKTPFQIHEPLSEEQEHAWQWHNNSADATPVIAEQDTNINPLGSEPENEEHHQ
jgi:hypothetical protein